MKQKFLLKAMLLLCALVVGSSSVWAEDKPWSCDDPTSTLDLKTVTSSNIGSFTDAKSYYIEDDYLLVSGCASRNATKPAWISQNNAGSSDSNVTTNWTANPPFKGYSDYTTQKYATLQGGRAIVYKVTNLKSLKVYGKNNSASKYLDIFIYTKSGDDYTKVEEIKYTADATVHVWNNATTLSPANTYFVYITGVGSSNSQLYEVAFERNTATEPYVSANDVSIYGDETSGQIAYTVGNPSGDGVVSAAEKTDVDWLSDVTVDAINNKVTFTTTANSTAVSRNATITITYTYNSGSKTVSKDVTVTQAKHVDYTAVYEKATAETMVLGGSYVWYGEKLNTGAYLAKGLGSNTYLGAVALGTDSRVRDTELSITDESDVQTFTFVPLATYGEWNILLGSNKLGINGDKKLYLDKGDISWTMSGTGSDIPTFTATYNSSDYTMYANIGSTRFCAYTSKGSNDDAILYHLATESSHTLTLDPNDGGSAATYHVKDGFSFVPFVPTRSGYTFLGWDTSSSATIPSVKLGDEYTMPAANTTLYAIWGTSVSVTIAGSGYSTIAKDCGLDFANATPAGLEAYIVPSITASTVSLEAIDEAPASTGVILKGTASTTYSIPVKADAAAIVGTNKLQAAVTATAIDANKAYILQGGLFHLVTAASSVPAGKAYLLASDIPTPAPELTFDFGNGNTTGISSLTPALSKVEGVVYDLQGRRVAQPTKGLYIVNGKKVVIK